VNGGRSNECFARRHPPPCGHTPLEDGNVRGVIALGCRVKRTPRPTGTPLEEGNVRGVIELCCSPDYAKFSLVYLSLGD